MAIGANACNLDYDEIRTNSAVLCKQLTISGFSKDGLYSPDFVKEEQNGA
jgi:hypothetical protein